LNFSASITIPIPPQPKRRVRAAVMSGKVRTYQDPKTKRYEQSCAIYLRQGAPLRPVDGPVALDIRFFHDRPKRLQQKTHKGIPVSDHPIRKATRPDLDNLCKAIADSLQIAGFYRDDGQLVRLTAFDYYVERGGEARTHVIFSELGA